MAVEIYDSIGGRDLNDYIAHLSGVRTAVRSEARAGGARARAKLAAHRDTGDSRIVVSYGSVDAFVSLDDTRGDQAAGIINNTTGALGSAF